ncbi:MAG: hypothetical protein Q9162_001562 [Coniocarpon cinnabarinum]
MPHQHQDNSQARHSRHTHRHRHRVESEIFSVGYHREVRFKGCLECHNRYGGCTLYDNLDTFLETDFSDMERIPRCWLKDIARKILFYDDAVKVFVKDVYHRETYTEIARMFASFSRFRITFGTHRYDIHTAIHEFRRELLYVRGRTMEKLQKHREKRNELMAKDADKFIDKERRLVETAEGDLRAAALLGSTLDALERDAAVRGPTR